MSTIFYADNSLVTDSAGVISNDDINVFSRNSVRKIFTSRCNTVAMAVVGNMFTDDEDAINIADIFATYLKKYKNISAIDEELMKPLESAMFKHAAFFHFILMTSIGKAIYTVESDLSGKKTVASIHRLRNNEIYALGTGSLFAHTAFIAGLGPFEAVRFAIESDSVSRLPIQHISMCDLTEYVPEESNEETAK